MRYLLATMMLSAACGGADLLEHVPELLREVGAPPGLSAPLSKERTDWTRCNTFLDRSWCEVDAGMRQRCHCVTLDGGPQDPLTCEARWHRQSEEPCDG